MTSQIRMLSIRQPWADAIANGLKDVENRSWRAFHEGPVLIVSGQRIHRNADILWPHHVAPMPDVSKLVLGYTTCVVDIVACVEDSKSPWALPDQFHWVLANPRPIEAIPWRGALGLTRLDDGERERIDQALIAAGHRPVSAS